MLIRLADASPIPWKNQGGFTRELLIWPDAADWVVRLSVATIDQSGAFSRFDGVSRWFTLIEGAGLCLHVGEQTYAIGADADPLCFDGALPCTASLSQGPLSAFNVMVRAGWQAKVKRLQPGDATFRSGPGWLALLALQAGTYVLGQDVVSRQAGELDWIDALDAVSVQARSGHWVVASFWPPVSSDQP